MEEEASFSLSDYVSVLKRRRWHMFFTFLAVMVISLLVAFGLPAKYRSSALIMIEGQDIPEDLVRSTVTSFADERVQRITQRAMTSVNLSRIIDDHELYPGEIERVPRSEIIEEMREDISIDLVAADVIDPRSGRPTKATIAFSISFDYGDAVKAQKVANDLVTLYRSVNLTESESQVEGAADFLDELAETHSKRVLELEEKLTDLKVRNGGALPDLLPANMQIMQRLERDLSNTEGNLQALKNRIIILEAQLLQTDPQVAGSLDGGVTTPEQALAILESELLIAESQYGDGHPEVRKFKRMIGELKRDKGIGSQTDVDLIDQRIQATESELEIARSRYGEDHPEIVRLNRSLSGLRESRILTVEAIVNGVVTPASTVANEINIREGPGIDTPVVGTLRAGETATIVDNSNRDWFKILSPSGAQGFVSRGVAVAQISSPALPKEQAVDTPTNPAYITLQANFMQAQGEAEGQLALYRNLQESLAQYQDLIDRTPLVEREYSALLRDLTGARERLMETSMKAEDARVGVMIVQQNKAQAFNLLEPPIAPTQPHWPNRYALVFLGFVLALFGTLAAAALAESMDDSIRSANDVQQIGGSPPLAIIPMIENKADTSDSRRGVVIVTAAIGGVMALALVAIHTLYKPLDVVWYAVMRKIGL